MVQLGLHKAPWHDGLLASFFQKHWSWVGSHITKFVENVFCYGEVSKDMNISLICLIPKQVFLETISQFKPICLTNMVLKVITKVVVVRLKSLIKDLVGSNQATFIPRRHTTYKIIITQEVIHLLSRNRGEKGAQIVKNCSKRPTTRLIGAS